MYLGAKKTLSLFSLLAFMALTLSAESAGALEKGQKAPELGISGPSGKPVSLAALSGKVVLVDFWASWCGPCRKELPVLEKLNKTYASKGLVIVGVNIDTKWSAAEGLLKDVKVSFPLVHDQAQKVAKQYAPPTMPSSYLIDQKGNIVRVFAGFRDADAAELESEIKKLLKI